MPVVLKEERLLTLAMIEGLAPDYATLRAAEGLADDRRADFRLPTTDDRRQSEPPDDRPQTRRLPSPDNGRQTTDYEQQNADDSLSGFTSADRLLWAEFAEGKGTPARAAVLLPTMAATCSCAGNRFPCRHILAVLLRDCAAPDLSGRRTAVRSKPDRSLEDWATAALRPARATGPDNFERRRAALVAGMADLRRWLADRVDHGLAALPAQGKRPWLDAANRLSDAYAPVAARELRALAVMLGSGPQWPERLLPRLGRLMLLAEGISRLDDLPPAEQGDLLAAAGLPPRLGEDRVTDEWVVLGRRQEREGRRAYQRTWLYGVASGRWALLESHRARTRPEGVCLPVGGVAVGELGFPPSAWPLSAVALSPLRLTGPAAGRSAIGDWRLAQSPIANLQSQFSSALAANPWLPHIPVLLSEVFVEPVEGPSGRRVWRLRDQSGRLLPLPPAFAHGWYLLALAGDRPLTLCSEWDGATLTPLSVLDGAGHWRDPTSWKGLP